MKGRERPADVAAEAIKNLGLRTGSRRPLEWSGRCPFCADGSFVLYAAGAVGGMRATFRCKTCGAEGKLGRADISTGGAHVQKKIDEG